MPRLGILGRRHERRQRLADLFPEHDAHADLAINSCDCLMAAQASMALSPNICFSAGTSGLGRSPGGTAARYAAASSIAAECSWERPVLPPMGRSVTGHLPPAASSIPG